MRYKTLVTTLVTAGATFFILEASLMRPIYFPLASVLVFGLWTVVLAAQIKHMHYGKRFFLIMPGLSLLLFGLYTLSVLEANYVRHLLAIVLSGLSGYFLYLLSKSQAGENAQSQLSIYTNYLSLLNIILLAIALFSAQIFFNLSKPLLLALAGFFVFLITAQLLWLIGYRLNTLSIPVAAIVLLMVEIFWALAFLPLGFYVKTVIVTVIYYTLLGLTRYSLAGQLDGRIIKRYMLISVVISLAVLMTARWV
jgi:hypothetical protein